ncbi:hypothetical protein C0995_012914 [Termitomyces sp. Mi166|nr:hypothetical protein C0995_012914 [Termitomyces sp. Mi166\
MERVVRELKEAVEHIKEAKAECRRVAEDLRQVWEDSHDVIEQQEPDLNQVLSVLNVIRDLWDLDPEANSEALRTWEEAKNSPDAIEWERSYHEELNSLKEMGVWMLIP